MWRSIKGCSVTEKNTNPIRVHIRVYSTLALCKVHFFAFQITCKAIACCQAALMWYLEMIDESSPEKVSHGPILM